MTLPRADVVFLRGATAADAGVLGNLLELYVHELSDVFPGLHVGPDGRFGYAKLGHGQHPEDRAGGAPRAAADGASPDPGRDPGTGDPAPDRGDARDHVRR